jgi:hypothetical protein
MVEAVDLFKNGFSTTSTSPSTPGVRGRYAPTPTATKGCGPGDKTQSTKAKSGKTCVQTKTRPGKKSAEATAKKEVRKGLHHFQGNSDLVPSSHSRIDAGPPIEGFALPMA